MIFFSSVSFAAILANRTFKWPWKKNGKRKKWDRSLYGVTEQFTYFAYMHSILDIKSGELCCCIVFQYWFCIESTKKQCYGTLPVRKLILNNNTGLVYCQ